jgi:parallel beta helix pectate lyase-like protein
MISRRKILKGGAAAAAIACVPFISTRRAFAQTVAPFDYFISPTGDDNNPGTLASPWSITAFNSKMSTYSGKRVGIIGDVAGVQTPIQYGRVSGVQTSLYSILNTQQNQPVLNLNGGTSSNSTVIASCNSSGVYTPRWAIIDASNPSGGAHATLDTASLMGQNGNTSRQVPNPGYITIDGLTIRNFSFSGISLEATGGPVMQNAVIQNCELYGSNTAVSTNNPGAIRIDNTSNFQLLNCKIHDCQNASGSNFGPYAYPALLTYDSTSVIVTNCTFYNIVSVQQKDATQDAVISYCYLDAGTFGSYSGNSYGTSYYEGTNAAGRTTTMHHNICLGIIWNQNATGASYAGNWNFYNNTCYVDNANPIFYLNPATGSTFHSYNNIFYSQVSWGAEYGLARFIGASSTLAPQWDYNYYRTAPTFYTGSLITYASWQAHGFDAHSNTGGSPFSGTPSAQVPSSFAVNTSSAAYTGGISGAICGAIDGSGLVGCDFTGALVPAAPTLRVS